MDAMWQEVVSWLVAGIGVVAAAAATSVINMLRARMRLRLTAEQEQRLRDVVHRGIGYAEEEVARMLKLGQISNSRDHQTAGAKLTAALGYVRAAFPLMDESAIVREIHAELARTPDIGATGGKTVS